MSWFHRQEYLDAYMADSNWKKLIHMVPSLLCKWNACLDQVEDSEEYFQRLCDRIGPHHTASYTWEEETMQQDWLEDVTVMDTLDVKDDKAPGKASIQLELAQSEVQSDILPGSAAWISFGLKLEEQQIELLKHVRSLEKSPTVEQQLSLQEKHCHLQTRIDSFTCCGVEYLQDSPSLSSNNLDAEWLDTDEDVDDAIPSTLSTSDIPVIVDATYAEQQCIPLPSSYGKEHCANIIRRMAQCELSLREGQANDALHLLCVTIAHSSFIFRSCVRKNSPKTNYAKCLRSYGNAHAVQMSIDNAAKVYSSAHKAMVILGTGDALLQQFKVLTRADLAASTAVANSNEAGQGKKKLSWIWHKMSENDDPVFVTEMYRVNWLRAKSRRDRWAEEKTLLQSELECTHRYFLYHMEQWKTRSLNTTAGFECYALQQAYMWHNFARQAEGALNVIKGQ
ncbi:hypothetical protein QCA50_011610 [Cerrena zonata]|uniref:Uncharacterized protein n=1 Tax=Cerrena zonata TaxID=2478898 RepID=A0AAW0G146_9APHY